MDDLRLPNVLRPWALDAERDHSLTCPTCLGVADYVADESAFVCRRCGARTAARGLLKLRQPGRRDRLAGFTDEV